MALQDEMLALLRRDPAFREELRRQLLTDELLGLPALVRELVETQRRAEERFDRLVERIDHLAEQIRTQGEEIRMQGEQIRMQGEQIRMQGEQIRMQGEQIRMQGEQVQRLAEEVRALVTWQRGEAGRREGERYERDLVRRAPVLFNGGEGGTPDDPWVRQRLTAQLRARLDEGLLPADEDPFLADLLWWKGEQVAVVEASIQVNGTDVARAAARAATLARAGARALAVVVGDQWATSDTARRAESVQVEWKVGADLSAGFLALRRQAPA
jgi:hypothetical protein